MANICNVADCFLWLDNQNDSDEEGISNLKLQKLSYYAQGFYLALFDRPLFDNTIEAWRHGPVVVDLYHKYKDYGKLPISFNSAFSRSSLEDNEFDLIAEVYETFGQFSAWRLRDMTHEESPWVDHQSDVSEIPHNELKEYFKNRLQ